MTNDEVNRWKLSAERIAELRGFIDQLLSTHNMYECIAIRDMLSEEITHEPCEQLSASAASSFNKTLARSPRRITPARDADHCDYPDCEHHWELVVDWALAAMKKLHESAEPDTDHPEIPAIIPAAAFRAFVDEHARLMRIRASAPQGASRDASSEPLQGASFPMSNERSHELAEWLRNNWAGHSMMMEIASMLEKGRGCPMANKYTFRSLGMLGQMYDPIGMEVNFPNDTEFYLASDIASSAL